MICKLEPRRTVQLQKNLGVIQSESEGMRTRGADGLNPSAGMGHRCPCCTKQTGWG